MEEVKILDFVGLNSIVVSHDKTMPNYAPPTVRITQRAGSMTFQHDMRHDQAREMGLALLAMAAAVENLVDRNAPQVADEVSQ